MPAHVQRACLVGGRCGECNACRLPWCAVCGAGEFELTVDCSGFRMSSSTCEATSAGTLGYTDALGWHGDPDQAERDTSPRFAK